ncbi:hypothetical protein T484DRAFT_1817212 [Baffinella frigidus]|nr:hypothetical protein T484DRAFT_1817212 [Cryptophyta sp. CCMP2293]
MDKEHPLRTVTFGSPETLHASPINGGVVKELQGEIERLKELQGEIERLKEDKSRTEEALIEAESRIAHLQDSSGELRSILLGISDSASPEKVQP